MSGTRLTCQFKKALNRLNCPNAWSSACNSLTDIDIKPGRRFMPQAYRISYPVLIELKVFVTDEKINKLLLLGSIFKLWIAS
jgi:hypothetical protein